jgi:two-component system, NtrC family, C4-dicarboxylate transport sensor histidine kinase DctB
VTRPPFPRWFLWLTATLLVAALGGWIAGSVVERRAIEGLTATARAEATLRAALFDSEMARYRLLAIALADDEAVVSGVTGDEAARRALDAKLETMAKVTGAPVIYLVAPSGFAIAASNWRRPDSFVGGDYRFRPYFNDARAHGAADQFARGSVSGRPGVFLSQRTRTGGVIVVKLEFPQIEAEWRGAGGITYVRNGDGVVMVTSRPDWRYRTTAPLTPDALRRVSSVASVDPKLLRPLALRSASGDDVAIGGQRYLVASMPTRRADWTLTLMRPIGVALRIARRTAMLSAGLAILTLSLLGWALLERRTRARRYTSELEQAVTERTAELRHQMEVRAATEARAADLREGLRQANRLASLGQITASVAHETAQPVAAIRTYSQTSETLLDRGEIGTVRDNLAAIRRLADRIGSVTSELRGFARRGTGEVRPVPLQEVIEGALLILRDQLRSVAIDVPRIAPGLMVLGGHTRLEQVLVILIQNAIEALQGRPGPAIRLTVDMIDDKVRVTVGDNGPGVPAEIAERLFTPFVTSRPNGLGLGLVIAQDIMTEFGGSLRLLDGTDGATFEIMMRTP